MSNSPKFGLLCTYIYVYICSRCCVSVDHADLVVDHDDNENTSDVEVDDLADDPDVRAAIEDKKKMLQAKRAKQDELRALHDKVDQVILFNIPTCI